MPEAGRLTRTRHVSVLAPGKDRAQRLATRAATANIAMHGRKSMRGTLLRRDKLQVRLIFSAQSAVRATFLDAGAAGAGRRPASRRPSAGSRLDSRCAPGRYAPAAVARRSPLRQIDPTHASHKSRSASAGPRGVSHFLRSFFSRRAVPSCLVLFVGETRFICSREPSHRRQRVSVLK